MYIRIPMANTRGGLRSRPKRKAVNSTAVDDSDGHDKEVAEELREEDLKREIVNLKSKVGFLSLPGPSSMVTPSFSDVVLLASESSECIAAHRLVLTNRSPVFKAMLENEMEESISGTIKISDASHKVLLAFVSYLYTAETDLDEQMALDLLVMAEKYEVQHLKTYCEKYLMSKLNWENSIPYYIFANKHNANSLLDEALLLIMANIEKLSKRDEYTDLLESDPRTLVKIYEVICLKK